MALRRENEPVDGVQVRLCGGLREDERSEVEAVLRGLDRPLQRFRSRSVDLELSVKDRATAQQYTVLECWIAGHPRLVASSHRPALSEALAEVRDDLKRQIERLLGRRNSLRRGGRRRKRLTPMPD